MIHNHGYIRNIIYNLYLYNLWVTFSKYMYIVHCYGGESEQKFMYISAISGAREQFSLFYAIY